MIGRSLGRYRIESQIGQGGMGIVFRAIDTALNRHVAIKILAPDRLTDPARRERFAFEARAASALNHPGIVTVHDIASEDGVDFIVMELVRGRTLDQVIGPSGLGVTQALRYGAALAAALAVAHEAGIVHRDLKPSNIIVTDDDGVKVLDFGLAKLVDPVDERVETRTRAAQLTESGTLLGTAAYMAPEQVEGKRVDARTDVFSFGGVLYEMLTGRRPFIADSQVAVMSKILHEDPPAPSQFAAIPPEVERTILRCLRKDPARRYQSMADLKVGLDDLIEESGSAPRPQPPVPTVARVSRRRWVLAAGGLLAIGASYLGWRAWPATPVVPHLTAVPLTSLPGLTRSPSFSPDGSQVAFSWTGTDGTNTDIYVQQIGSGAPLRLTTHAAGDESPQWSPDGRWIAFLRRAGDQRHELRLVPPLGGPERRITEVGPRPFLRQLTFAWCPDSTCVVVTESGGDGRPDPLVTIALDTGTKRQLTRPPDGVMSDNDPAISPNGAWLVFRRDVAPFAGELHLQRLGEGLVLEGEARPVTDASLYAYSPSWLPDSSGILFGANGALWRLATAPGATPERLPFVGEDGIMPVVSRARIDGAQRLVYVRSYSDTNIWRIDTTAPGVAASSPPTLAVASNRRDATAGLAPDGRHVAFTSTRSGENEIWRASTSGAEAVQLTTMRANPGFPRWSPTGDRIAFHARGVGGGGDVFVISAEGGIPVNVTSRVGNDAFPSFSRDGRWIYYSSVRSGDQKIWKVPSTGGTPVPVSADSASMAVESPDGAYLFYSGGQSANSPATLWRMPIAGGTAEKIADGVIATAFDVVPDGVYYIERLRDETRVNYVDAASRLVTTVARNLGTLDFGLSVSHDGRTILFTRLDSSVNDLMLVEGFR